MRLIAFGCSLTFGVGLSDIWDYKKNKCIYESPSKFAWPQLVANKLNIECVNKSKAGAGTKEIWFKIVNTKFKNSDIVIVMWSNINRHCIINEENHSIQRVNIWDKDDQSKLFYKYFWCPSDFYLETLLRVNHIQLFLQDKVKLIKHLMSSDTIDILKTKLKVAKSDQEKFNILTTELRQVWNIVQFLEFDGVRQDICDEKYGPLALDDHHPGPLAHEKFANKIFEQIKL